MTNIYDQHQSAFARVSAYVVVKGGERVATIAFKYLRDGAGRLYAYVHWLSTEMVRGFAGGGGYDKHSAACSDAAEKLKPENGVSAFAAALQKYDGKSWRAHLTDAGFDVWQAV